MFTTKRWWYNSIYSTIGPMDNNHSNRRLAAILVADVVGYSRLMSADQSGTLNALRQLRGKLFDPVVADHRGKVIKRLGDGWIVDFPSISDAVNCGLAIQIGLTKQDTIKLRMGIHTGEVTFEVDDIFGDGVNIASRLEALAQPGQVLLSDSAYNSLDGKAAGKFSGGETYRLKNIVRPVGVWRWPSNNEPDTHISEPVFDLPEKPSIAVLPFANTSVDSEQEYFADGLTEDIITRISKFRWLLVIARNSTFFYKGKTHDVRQIGKSLGAHYVLEGSVRRAGSRIRVSAQLIKTNDGSHLWAETYDRQMTDIFELQDDIATKISASLEPEIEKAQWKHVAKQVPVEFSAWDQYLRGLPCMHAFTREGNQAARIYFSKAAEIDPEFAQAHSGLANVIFNDILDGYATDVEKALQDAFHHAKIATSIDDQDGFAHCILGRVSSIQGRFDEAISELQTAIHLNPSLALAYHGLAYAHYHGGDAQKSIPLFEAAQALSPHDHNVWAFLGIRAFAFIQLGEFQAAVKCARESVGKPHAKFWANVALVSSLGHVGQIEEAREQLIKLKQRKPDISAEFIAKSLGFSRYPEQIQHLIDGLRVAGLPESSGK